MPGLHRDAKASTACGSPLPGGPAGGAGAELTSGGWGSRPKQHVSPHRPSVTSADVAILLHRPSFSPALRCFSPAPLWSEGGAASARNHSSLFIYLFFMLLFPSLHTGCQRLTAVKLSCRASARRSHQCTLKNLTR